MKVLKTKSKTMLNFVESHMVINVLSVKTNVGLRAQLVPYQEVEMENGQPPIYNNLKISKVLVQDFTYEVLKSIEDELPDLPEDISCFEKSHLVELHGALSLIDEHNLFPGLTSADFEIVDLLIKS